MDDYEYLKGSNGNGDAALAHVEAIRSIGATTLNVDNTDNWPAKFIATSGVIDANGYIDPDTVTQFKGHLSGGDIVIDSFEAGYTDQGNTTDQVVIIKQTTGWANAAAGSLESFSTEIINRTNDTSADLVVSGGIWATLTGLNASMTQCVLYINGKRLTIPAVATRAFTANKDVYVDVLLSGSVASLVYTDSTIGAASAALAANSSRLAKITTSGAAITAIAQTGWDSLGNFIYNTNPNPTLLGYAERTTDASTTTSDFPVTGLSKTVIVPANRRLKITAFTSILSNSVVNGQSSITIWDGAVGSGTRVSFAAASNNGNAGDVGSHTATAIAIVSPAAGSKTYNIGLSNVLGGTARMVANAQYPAFIMIEVV